MADEDATDYDGSGFRSEASIDGRFRYTFDEPGVYHYVSEGHGAIGRLTIIADRAYCNA